MAKDDYWVVVFKILKYHYEMMKQGKEPVESEIDEYKLRVNRKYIINIYKNMFDEGYLTGSEVIMDGTAQEYVNDMASVRITSKGIEYLEENTKMKQAYRLIKELKDWIPGIQINT